MQLNMVATKGAEPYQLRSGMHLKWWHGRATKRKDVSFADFLEEVPKAERDARARQMLTRTAGFPALTVRHVTVEEAVKLRSDSLGLPCIGEVGGMHDHLLRRWA